MKKFVLFGVLTGIGVVTMPAGVLAASMLQFSPASGSYTGTDDIAIEVRLSGDDEVTSVKAYLDYDASVLHLVDVDSSTSIFPYWWEKALTRANTGEVRLQASAPSGQMSGLVAVLHFRALKAGTTSLVFTSDSLALTSDDVNTLDRSALGSASITTTGTVFFAPAAFGQNLRRGDQGPDVKRLQVFLNTNGYQIASSGPGAPGQETDFFGALTERAVIRFQEANSPDVLVPFGLSRGTGFVGPSTRAFLNRSSQGRSSEVISLLREGTLPAAPQSSVFGQSLFRGMQSEDVRRLQQLLASDSGVYPEGLTTGYFGSLTEQAVQRFQLKHGVVSTASDPGYGVVGPKTRAKLQEIF